jgi:hypothetical protein
MLTALRLRLAALALLAWLAGCGPGVGGTGTGVEPPDLASFGASPAPLCGSSFASALRCPPANGATVPTSEGTAAVVFVDSASGGQINVTFEANRLGLEAICQGLLFAGNWGIDAAGALRFYGSVRPRGSALDLPAVLSVQLQPGGGTGELNIVLQNLQGDVLLGPVVLGPATGAVASACP